MCQASASKALDEQIPRHLGSDSGRHAVHIGLKQFVRRVAGCYDFVYVPHDKNKKSNVALAFVNFVDHLSAKTLGQRSGCQLQRRLFAAAAKESILHLARLESSRAWQQLAGVAGRRMPCSSGPKP